MLRWQRMRQGVADIHRRAQVSRAANGRYLEALTATAYAEPVGPTAESIFAPVRKGPRRYRALNPWTQADGTLLDAVSTGAWVVNGFRNRDVRAALFPKAKDAREEKRLAARTTRLLALLRAHGLIQKISGRIAIKSPTKAARSSPRFKPPAAPASPNSRNRRLKIRAAKQHSDEV